MIDVRNLTKVYPGTVAVSDISFQVAKGEIVGFLGPNGAGKSTTLKILTCFLPPTTGQVQVAGFDVVRDSLEVRRRVGYLPENNPLYPEMRVGEYLNFRAGLKQVPGSRRAKAVADAVERCGLGDVRGRIIGQLSKGYRQRVGLADAIVHDPELVILDEPTVGLDPNQIRQVRDLIRDLGKTHTVLFSSHTLSEVERLCQRVMIINRGRIVADGPLNRVNRITETGRVRLDVRGAADGAREVLEKAAGVKGVVVAERGDLRSFLVEPRDERDIRPEIFRAAAQAGWDVVELTMERVSLEDAFAELTVDKVPLGDALGAPAPAGEAK